MRPDTDSSISIPSIFVLPCLHENQFQTVYSSVKINYKIPKAKQQQDKAKGESDLTSEITGRPAAGEERRARRSGNLASAGPQSKQPRELPAQQEGDRDERYPQQEIGHPREIFPQREAGGG